MIKTFGVLKVNPTLEADSFFLNESTIHTKDSRG